MPWPTCATATAWLSSPIHMAPSAAGEAQRWRALGPHSPKQQHHRASPTCLQCLPQDGGWAGQACLPLPRDSPHPQGAEAASPCYGLGRVDLLKPAHRPTVENGWARWPMRGGVNPHGCCSCFISLVSEARVLMELSLTAPSNLSSASIFFWFVFF